jgi:protein AroM
MSETLGLVTIGQAPRTDVTPEIESHLPADVDVREVGALDRFDAAEEIMAAAGPEADLPVYVTRLANGDSVTVDRDAVHELTQKRIRDIEDEVGTIGLLCTGSFPGLTASVPILEPSELLAGWADSIVTADALVGVLMPKDEQAAQTHAKWGEHTLETASGSPYDGLDAVTAGAKELGTAPDLVVLDCIGYTEAMKAEVRSITGAPVLLARSVLWKTATELL